MIYFSWIMWTHEEYIEFMKDSSFMFKRNYVSTGKFSFEDLFLLSASSIFFFAFFQDSKFAYALFSGIFCYFHYHYTVKAFETTASTIILPLLQVINLEFQEQQYFICYTTHSSNFFKYSNLYFYQFPSIVTFILSSIHKSYLGKPWLESYIHIIAYFILFLGGLLPATNGKIGIVLDKAFWKKP